MFTSFSLAPSLFGPNIVADGEAKMEATCNHKLRWRVILHVAAHFGVIQRFIHNDEELNSSFDFL